MWDGYFPESFSHVFTISQLNDFIEDAVGPSRDVTIVPQGRTEYFNIPAAFDIEASSWSTGSFEEDNVQHFATMYIWQFGLNGSVIYGRTWNEFGFLISKLEEVLHLSSRRHLVVYIHNLGYEFQWLRRWFTWDKVFAIKNRRPVYAISDGIEFRCSYFLSNYALSYIGDELLQVYPIKKLTGFLDYKKVRHSGTPLTAKELAYAINDVKVVMSYIQEKIEQDGDITKIPLTNTGYVRNYCREACFGKNISQLTEEEIRKITLNYKAIMKSLQVENADAYNQLKRGFMGGFTHTSILHSNEIMEDVGSADLTSSYPYQIVAKYFPMTRFQYIGTVKDPELFKKLLSHYCCIFDIEFNDLKPRVEFENIISTSRCFYIDKDTKVNNGRIISSKCCRTTITELDFENISRFYQWSSIKVINMRTAHRGYLPKDLILAVLELYSKKTSLKGISEKAIEYLVSKNMINAVFGMMVTDIVRGEYAYESEEGWCKFEADVENQLSKYNKNFNRFLYYGWGVWVTAHARHCLFSAIYEFGADYVYSDTDSIKGINFEDHEQYFITYNNHVKDSLIKMCASLGIPYSKCAPKTKKGVTKTIGVWDIEEGYLRFKAVGAKRYIYEYPNHVLQLTVGGLNKSQAVPYLLWKYGGGSSEFNENQSAAYLSVHSIEPSPYYTPFQQLARLAYSRADGHSEAMEFLLSQLMLNYDPIFVIFGEGLYVPPLHTGKQTVDYIDDSFTAICTDYLGLSNIVYEKSAIYMEEQNYKMSITDEYRDLLKGVEHVAD